MIDWIGFLTLGGGIVGVTAWSIRQEGRINGHDKLFDERKAQDTLRQEHSNDRHAEIKERLTRIESKLDRLNGSH